MLAENKTKLIPIPLWIGLGASLLLPVLVFLFMYQPRKAELNTVETELAGLDTRFQEMMQEINNRGDKLEERNKYLNDLRLLRYMYCPEVSVADEMFSKWFYEELVSRGDEYGFNAPIVATGDIDDWRRPARLEGFEEEYVRTLNVTGSMEGIYNFLTYIYRINRVMYFCQHAECTHVSEVYEQQCPECLEANRVIEVNGQTQVPAVTPERLPRYLYFEDLQFIPGPPRAGQQSTHELRVTIVIPCQPIHEEDLIQ